MKLTKNFSLAELTVTATRAKNEPTDEALESLQALCENVLQPLRDALGPIQVTSGYRSPEVNFLVGGAQSSQHLRGEAADILVPGKTPKEVCEAILALELPFDQVINEFDVWVHVSHVPGGPQRGQYLKAARVNGRTTYKPVTGK